MQSGIGFSNQILNVRFLLSQLGGEPRKKQPHKRTTPLKKQLRIYPEKNNHIKKTTVSLSRKKQPYQ